MRGQRSTRSSFLHLLQLWSDATPGVFPPACSHVAALLSDISIRRCCAGGSASRQTWDQRIEGADELIISVLNTGRTTKLNQPRWLFKVPGFQRKHWEQIPAAPLQLTLSLSLSPDQIFIVLNVYICSAFCRVSEHNIVCYLTSLDIVGLWRN